MVFRDPEDMNKENDDVSGEQNIFSPLTDLVSGALAAANISESAVMSGVCVCTHPIRPFHHEKQALYFIFSPSNTDYFLSHEIYNTTTTH
jgi:hypothetical protein